MSEETKDAGKKDAVDCLDMIKMIARKALEG